VTDHKLSERMIRFGADVQHDFGNYQEDGIGAQIILAAVDALVAAAEADQEAARDEWQAQSEQVGKLQKERAVKLAEYALHTGERTAVGLEDSIAAAYTFRAEAAEKWRAAAVQLQRLRIIRHHAIEAGRLWAGLEVAE